MTAKIIGTAMIVSAYAALFSFIAHDIGWFELLKGVSLVSLCVAWILAALYLITKP